MAPFSKDAARKAGQTGVVMLRLDKQKGAGKCRQLVKSSGHALLENRARGAGAALDFRPARRDGRKVATQVEVPVRFSFDR